MSHSLGAAFSAELADGILSVALSPYTGEDVVLGIHAGWMLHCQKCLSFHSAPVETGWAGVLSGKSIVAGHFDCGWYGR